MDKNNQLVTFYAQQQLNAQSAILHGDFVQADLLYQHAFKVSLLILKQHPHCVHTIDVVLNACMDCVDYCLPSPAGQSLYHEDETHFLIITVTYLIELITTDQNKQLRKVALLKFSNLIDSLTFSNMHENYVRRCIHSFEQIWSTYSAELINTQ